MVLGAALYTYTYIRYIPWYIPKYFLYIASLSLAPPVPSSLLFLRATSSSIFCFGFSFCFICRRSCFFFLVFFFCWLTFNGFFRKLHFLLWHSLVFLFSCYFSSKRVAVVAVAHDHGCHIRF